MPLKLRQLTSILCLTLFISVSPPIYAKAKDFFRLNTGGLLISGTEMKYSEVMEVIKKDKLSERIGRDRYILDASVGGLFDVQLKFSGGRLTEIDAKQLGRKHH